VLIVRRSLSHKARVLISDPCSDQIEEMPQNAGSDDAKRVQKCAAILKNLPIDTVLAISAWFPVHAKYNSTCT